MWYWCINVLGMHSLVWRVRLIVAWPFLNETYNITCLWHHDISVYVSNNVFTKVTGGTDVHLTIQEELYESTKGFTGSKVWSSSVKSSTNADSIQLMSK